MPARRKRKSLRVCKDVGGAEASHFVNGDLESGSLTTPFEEEGDLL
jgi:hypothetical protein